MSALVGLGATVIVTVSALVVAAFAMLPAERAERTTREVPEREPR